MHRSVKKLNYDPAAEHAHAYVALVVCIMLISDRDCVPRVQAIIWKNKDLQEIGDKTFGIV